MSDSELLLPAEYLRQGVRNLLNDSLRPSLGINYLDLENNNGFDRLGALVFHPSLRAVEFGSPAAEAGVLAGDHIVAVNGTVITDQRSLTAIVQSYKIGDTITLQILRDGIEEDIELILE